MSVEAMKQALEALALFASDESDEGQVAIAAHEELRQAIEQAEKQEPVAWIKDVGDYNVVGYETSKVNKLKHGDMLYTAPPQREWVGLTDEEVTEMFCDYEGSQFPAFVRAIEADLKEKNYVD